MSEAKKPDATKQKYKFEFRQKVALALIGALVTLIPSILKIITDSRKITTLENEVTAQRQARIAGTYDWQWATDDGWSVQGSISVKADGRASLTLDRWMMCESERKSKKIVLARERSALGPQFEPIANSQDVKVSLPVEFNAYDKNCKIIGKDLQVIEGRIGPVIAYSGKVNYLNEQRGSYQGNMVLVRSIEGTP